MICKQKSILCELNDKLRCVDVSRKIYQSANRPVDVLYRIFRHVLQKHEVEKFGICMLKLSYFSSNLQNHIFCDWFQQFLL